MVRAESKALGQKGADALKGVAKGAFESQNKQRVDLCPSGFHTALAVVKWELASGDESTAC